MEHPLVDQLLAVSLLVVDGWYFWGCTLDTLICKNTLNSGIMCGRIRSHLQVITTVYPFINSSFLLKISLSILSVTM